MEKTILEGSVKATASQKNPLQTNLEFVFTDFLPNKNKQGVPVTEVDNLLRTGIDQPVKADFRRGKLGDHSFSLPVGHITNMESRGDQVIGHAVLYKDEFPDLAGHLEKASASDDGVHFSWELYHGDHFVDDAGITWFTDCLVAATTIVANPAYGGRTPLLAMAAEDTTQRVEELERQVATLEEQLSHSEGIESMDPVEELKQQVAALTERLDAMTRVEEPVAELEVSPDVAALTSELDELRKFKSDYEKEQARAAVLTTRREALKSVLAGDEFDAKADFIAGLDEDQFKTFSESMAAAAAKGKQTASTRFNGIPDPISGADNTPTDISGLAKALREKK